MDRIWKKLSGLFFASLMAVTLTGRANADDDAAALPEPAPTAAVEPAEAPAPAAAEPVFTPEDEISAPPAEAPAPAAEASAPEAESPVPAAEAPKPEAEAPATEALALAAEASTPEAESPAPGEEEPAPAAEDPAPGTEEEGSVPAAEEEEAADDALLPPAYSSVDPETGMESALSVLLDVSGEEPADGDPTDADPTGSDPADSDSAADETGEAPAEEFEEVILAGNGAVRDVSSDKALLIKTAGFQHISTLSSQGDVNIVGTGILLVDRVRLPDDRGVWLQSVKEIYGEDGGTAALFLRTGESDGMTTYELINSTYEDDDGEHVVPAILDEEYVIPEGISLVVPDGGRIIMQSTVALHEEGVDENGDPVSVNSYSLTESPARQLDNGTYRYVVSAPTLTIAEGARLTVESGACVQSTLAFRNVVLAVPILNINGDLTLGDGVELNDAIVTVGPRGTVSGTGLIVDSEITVQGRRGKKQNVPAPALDLNVTGSQILLDGDGADLGSLHVFPDRIYEGQYASYPQTTELVYFGAPSIGDLRVEAGSTLNVRSTNKDGDNGYFGFNSALTVTDSLSGGGSVNWDTGVLTIAGAAAVDGGVSVAFSSGVSTIYDYTGRIVFDADGVNSPLPRFESGTSVPAQSSVPVYVLTASGSHTGGFGGIYYFYSVSFAKEIDPYTGSQVTYDAVRSLVGEDDMTFESTFYSPGSMFSRRVLLEVYADGVYSYLPLNGSSASVPAADVQRILVLGEDYRSVGQGGATTTATDTAYTGSGILGGSGAGSVSGGPRRLALTGSRSSDPEPEPEPEPEPQPPAGELRVWAEETEGGRFLLHIERGGKALGRLAAPVTVRMEYRLPGEMAGKPLYAVFRDITGTLTAFEAHYDPDTGLISFASNVSGRFVIAALDFGGEPFSEDFYKALAETDAVQALFS